MLKSLVTGITGQDGSYLAELLLEKGYKVYGLKRRTSTENTSRIDHIIDSIELIDGDLTDSTSLIEAVKKSKPDEVYNLAAQSFVQSSFTQPEYTGDVTGLGALRMLEAVRKFAPQAKFYQASTSEMLGASPPPQDETTSFHPRSPYGVAKLYAHWATINYRESYNMFNCTGILFNHECVVADTPIIIRKKGIIDIVPIEEVVTHREDPKHGKKYTSDKVNFEVWDKDDWVKITCATATWAEKREIIRVASRSATFCTTPDHVIFKEDNGKPKEVKSEDVHCGMNLSYSNLPNSLNVTDMLCKEAWLLGALVADGSITEDNKGRFTKTDKTLLDKVSSAWNVVTGGTVTVSSGISGFTGKDVPYLNLNGDSGYLSWIRDQMYTEKGFKRIPLRVLNGNNDVRLAFLRGYNECDGLKGGHCKYEFKSFTTNSSVLAAGLWWLIKVTLKQRSIICLEERDNFIYYHINMNSPNSNNKGSHLQKSLTEVVKSDRRSYTGWLFDLATESGTFHAGIGDGWIHNSPRRGIEFVTQKIAHGVAAIKNKDQKKLYLGNLDAKRDWGHARCFTKAMHLMLQQKSPDDFVIATGEAHTVREFCEVAFSRVGLDYKDYVEVDPKFYRPAEVNYLLGNAHKAQTHLGWKPEVTFKQLVSMMVDSAMEHYSSKSHEVSKV